MSETSKSLTRAPRLGRHCSRAALQAAAVLLAALVLSVAASARVPGRGADLVETRVGTPPAEVVAGGSFELADTVTNRGRALARRSVTRYYLRSGRASMLVGARRVPALGPGGTRAGARSCGRLPARSPDAMRSWFAPTQRTRSASRPRRTTVVAHIDSLS